FEPPTPASRTQYSTRLSYAPFSSRCKEATAESKRFYQKNRRFASQPRQRQLAPRNRPFLQHITPESEQLGRAPRTTRLHLAGLFHQILLFDQPAKILLVQVASGQGFDGLLQLQQRKTRWHELEHHRPVLDLGAQSRDAGGE